MKPIPLVLLVMGLFLLLVLIAGGLAVYSGINAEEGKIGAALLVFLSTFFGVIFGCNQLVQVVVTITSVLETPAPHIGRGDAA